MRDNKLFLFNTLTRKKEEFIPIKSPFVGMYVCGPTVYGDPHLGHARPGVTFDILFRYLQHLGYKVRYVRNITDVGHLENDADVGEDKIAKKARLEQLEPMEVAQYYTNRYHKYMDCLNVLHPSIEPQASGHIIEQIEVIQKILDSGYAYEKNGSVYFNVRKYNADKHYGKLSGRVIDELLSTTRTNLNSQEEKENTEDFALWKKASPEHIMRWSSPWSEGFPGWHIECTAMSCKYLGMPFDIHGGGMDLLFPHHESEIAQATAAYGQEACKYWVHNNMITINGQKMGKSLGNFITLEELFNGSHQMLEQAYSPMTIRFFILQAHYRSTLDFSNEALQAAGKGMQRLINTQSTLNKLNAAPVSDVKDALLKIKENCYIAMDDDFNTPITISHLFELVKLINMASDGNAKFTAEDIQEANNIYTIFVNEILGLENEVKSDTNAKRVDGLVQMLLNMRARAKVNKDYATSDLIRDELLSLGIQVMDGKEGATWQEI